MIPRNLKPGDTFSDGPLFYKVLSVNEDGSYISTRVEVVAETDKAEPDTSEENAESKPGETEQASVVKKPRSSRQK